MKIWVVTNHYIKIKIHPYLPILNTYTQHILFQPLNDLKKKTAKIRRRTKTRTIGCRGVNQCRIYLYKRETICHSIGRKTVQIFHIGVDTKCNNVMRERTQLLMWLLTLLDGRLFNWDMGDEKHKMSPPCESTLIDDVDCRYSRYLYITYNMYWYKIIGSSYFDCNIFIVYNHCIDINYVSSWV